ncbi:hypothetical protein BC835DRAFT_1045756 [Cytidiella melzeri]|nr:hypothetical protein BC835DRAFT_1045756 [Cytidiella melzeri]
MWPRQARVKYGLKPLLRVSTLAHVLHPRPRACTQALPHQSVARGCHLVFDSTPHPVNARARPLVTDDTFPRIEMLTSALLAMSSTLQCHRETARTSWTGESLIYTDIGNNIRRRSACQRRTVSDISRHTTYTSFANAKLRGHSPPPDPTPHVYYSHRIVSR